MYDTPLTLSVTRFIAAPPASVWVIMTERQEEWWCPLPWKTEVVAQDWRAGGGTHVIMRGPDGEVHSHKGIFLEVVPGVRWSATDAFELDDSGRYIPTGPFMVGTWAIAAANEAGVDGTRYTATARHWTEEAHNSHKDMGFEAGWMACADQLAALCET
jgi:uncharacterized protein YndB with AHSA1/START domain